MMTPEQRELVEESLRMLVAHEPFKRFMNGLDEMREKAIEDCCRMDVVENPYKVASMIGAISSLTDIKNLVAEFEQKHLE